MILDQIGQHRAFNLVALLGPEGVGGENYGI
jgi:hypothetical protein